MTLDVQFMTMLSMVIGGIYLGIALDTFRRLSMLSTKNKVVSYVLEVCFWLIQTALLFYVLFRVNGGELRVYVFLACLLGFSIYQVAVASIYNKMLESIIHVVQSIYRLIKKIVQTVIITPIIWIIKSLSMILLFILQGLATVVLFILKIIYLPLKWIVQLLYCLLPKRIKKIIYQFVRFYSTIKGTCMKYLKSITHKRR